MSGDPLQRGIAAQQAGDLDEARRQFRQVLAHHPKNPDLNRVLGLLELQAGRPEAALGHFETVLAQAPADESAGLGLARAALATGDVGRADAALAALPDHLADACGLRARTAEAKDDMAAALDWIGRAVAAKPGDADLVRVHARMLRETGRSDEALPLYRAVTERQPGHAEAWVGLGAAYWELERPDDALAAYDRAVGLEPANANARWNRAMVLLAARRYGDGWAEYDARWQAGGGTYACGDLPRWDGGPLDGRTVILGAEQGLGDIVQFVRFAPLVAGRGGRVIVEAPERLADLIATCAGIDAVWVQGTPRPLADLQCPLASVPGLFVASDADVPAACPYLSPPAGPAVDLGASGPVVGLVWSGQTWPRANRKRSAPPEALAPVLAVQGVTFASLQYGAGVDALRAAAPAGAAIIDASAHLEGFAATARAMAACDAVVTVDTSSAHLAGALGLPVAILLPTAADWRWGLSGETTPWYPTARLFRQTHAGDWSAPMAGAAQWVECLSGERA